MTVPLYEFSKESKTARTFNDKDSNAGLWYNKFCDQWIRKPKEWFLKDGGKLGWISKITGKPIGNPVLIKDLVSRYENISKSRNGIFKKLANESRFITGLGYSNPVENGFTFHHTLGVPYLPGSSLKGLFKDWLREEGVDKKIISRYCGNGDGMGILCFMDVLPVEKVQLTTEIITSHYGGWNSENPPGDWLTPTPIPLLAVERGTCFAFSIIPLEELEDKEKEKILDWLCDALEWSGAGAKTSVGFGRFSRSFKQKDSVEDTTFVPEKGTAHYIRKNYQGQIVEAEMIPETTKSGKPKAKHIETGATGIILGSENMPDHLKPGDRIKLKLNGVHPDKNVDFVWVSQDSEE